MLPTVVPTTKTNNFTIPTNLNLNLPYIPKIFSKIIYEFGKMMVMDDRHDIGTFSTALHPSSIHHCYIGGGMITASTVTGLLSDLNDMLDELEDDVAETNNPMLQQLMGTARNMLNTTNNMVQKTFPKDKAYRFGIQAGPVPTAVVIQEKISQQQQNPKPIYMGKIQAVSKPLPPPPPPPKTLLPGCLKGKGKAINTPNNT